MNTNTFPLTFNQHLIFVCIAVVFVLLQFIRQKYWYQPFVIAAMAGSMLIYVSESSAWYYAVGVLELLLMLTAGVLYIVQARKLAKAEKAKKEAEKAAEQAAAESAEAAEGAVAPAAEAEPDAAAAANEIDALIAEIATPAAENPEPAAEEAATEETT